MILNDFTLATMIIFMVCAVVPMVKADLTPKELEDKLNSIEQIAKEIKTVSISDTNYLKDIQRSVNTPNMNIFGTDYSPADNGTIFLQLLDNNRQAVSSASCYINGWYPNKSFYLSDVLMNYLDEGLFYYDVTIPSILGIYMLSGSCYLPSSAWSDDFLDYTKIESYEDIFISNNKVSLLDATALDTYIWYHLNENSGTNVPDSSGNSRNGTTQNMEDGDWVAGKLNNSLQFDGVDEYINVDYSILENITDEITLEAWIYPTASADKDIIVKSGAYTLTLDKVGGNFFTRGSIFSSSTEYIATSTTSMSINNWYHIVMVFKNSYVYIYQNGVQEGQSTQCVFCNIDTNTNNITIAGNTNYFAGKIDEVVIYDNGLSQTNITFRWNDGNGTESMGKGNITSGYIRSNPINLNGTSWGTFNADYDLKEGNITFQILNETNSVICNGLGDILTCANNITPIKLYAEFSRMNFTLISPEIDRWYVNMNLEITEEIKGAGELNVKNWGAGNISVEATVNVSEIAEAVWDYNGTVSNNILNQIANAIWTFTGSIANEIALFFSDTIWSEYLKEADISVGATEYEIGEIGVISAKVTVAGQPISNAHCDAIIFNSSKSEIDGFELTYVNNSRGLYSGDFIVPNETGIYMVDVICIEPTVERFQNHHFGGMGDPPTELFFKNSTMNNLTQIDIDASDFFECYPDRFSVSYSDFENGEFEPYRFATHIDNTSIWVKKDLGVAKEWTVALRFYKETDLGELTLGAVISTEDIGTTPIQINFTNIDINAPFDDLSLLEVAFCSKSSVDPEKTISFMFGDNITDSQFTLHTLGINATTNFEVGGSAEIKVVEVVDFANLTAEVNISEITEDVWNSSDRTLTATQSLWVGGTEYSPDETTGKIVVRILNKAGDPVDEANCTAYIFYPNNTQYAIEQMTEATNVSIVGIYYVDFTLGEPTGVYPYGINCEKLGTDYFLLDTFHIFGANRTEQAREVWEYSERNLTYTPPYPTPNNLTASDVWTYGTRDLTYYPTVNLTLSNDSASAIAEAVWTWQGTIGDNILTQVADKIQCYLTRLFTEEDEKWGIDIPIC